MWSLIEKVVGGGEPKESPSEDTAVEKAVSTNTAGSAAKGVAKPAPKADPNSSPKAAPKEKEKAAAKEKPKASPKASPKEKAKASPKASPKEKAKASPKASPETKAKSSPNASPETKAKPKASPKAGAAAAEGAAASPKASPKTKAKGKAKAKSATGPNASIALKIVVKNLTDDATEMSVREMFAEYGKVKNVEVKTRNDGRCRGFGFVTFAKREECDAAIAGKNEQTVGGKVLEVVMCDKPDSVNDPGKGKGKDLSKGKGKGTITADGKGDGKGGKGKGKGKQSQMAEAYQNAYMGQMQALYGGYGAAYQHHYNQAMYSQALQAQQIAAAQHQQMAYQQYAAAMALSAVSPQGMTSTLSDGSRFGMQQAAPPKKNNKQYEGSLRSHSDKNGYGFIACEETYKLYQRDVYVSKENMPAAAKVLDRIKFKVEMNEKGHPRASNVKLVGKSVIG